MEYVIKRNGAKALFDKDKIVNAIEKAMTATRGGIDSRVSHAIADRIPDLVQWACHSYNRNEHFETHFFFSFQS